jgi:hypothetical protein
VGPFEKRATSASILSGWRLKPRLIFAAITARPKPCPFKADSKLTTTRNLRNYTFDTHSHVRTFCDPQEAIGTMDHMEILFKEYDTLRAEILGRQTGGFQLVVIAGAAFAWLATRATDSWGQLGSIGKVLWIIGGVALLSIYIWLANWAIVETKLISRRLMEIEQRINNLAGDKLLVWETERSVTARGWKLFG